MTLRVLENRCQFHLKSVFLLRRQGNEYDKDSEDLLDPIIGHQKVMIDPVFNRVGWYFDGEKCWYEFQLPSGRIVAALSDVKQFKDDLALMNARDNPISDDDWDMIKLLLKRSVIEDCKRFEFERRRRGYRMSQISIKRHTLKFKKRLKELRNEGNS